MFPRVEDREVLPLERIDAVIFDMDGVVTDTARVHAAAWQQMFDEYLQRRRERTGETIQPFDITRDYLRYVDGKPRYDGVKSFLESRGISLTYGDPEDPPDRETVCGLGNRKNQYFLDRVKEAGVEPYRSSVEFIQSLREKKVRTAIISASRNAAQVLEAGKVLDLFDTKVDGFDSDELQLKGKPNPAIFLEAARRLGVEPPRAAVIEDSLAGVEAGHRGKFGLVIGVDRGEQAQELRAKGADVVVKDLSQLLIEDNRGNSFPRVRTGTMQDLPSALEGLEEIISSLEGRTLAVFLDYDGTLTPIVDDPGQARLAGETRAVIQGLAGRCLVAVISGRDLADVRGMVAIDGIAYAGSHGFDIVSPDGSPLGQERWQHCLPPLDRAETELRQLLEGVPGVRVERKRFAIAVHYRAVDDEQVSSVEEATDQVAAREEGLRKVGGKRIFELRPNIDWDKGKALHFLLEALDLDREGVAPLFIGDDVTDEDAFESIQESGIGIVVLGEEDRDTAARYALQDPTEVRRFLENLNAWLEERPS